MKRSGLPIVLAVGLGCQYAIGASREVTPAHYAAIEVRRETRADGEPSLFRPVALGTDETSVFVLDMDGHDIKVFSRSGHFQRTIGRKGQGPGEFHLPSGLDILGGKLYVADSLNRRVQVLDTKGGYLSGFNTTFSPHGILALGPDRMVVLSLPSDRAGQEKVLHGFDAKGELLWEAEDSFFSGDSVYDLMKNRRFMLRAGEREFFLVPGTDGRLIRRLDADGTLLGGIEIAVTYRPREIDITASGGRKKTLRPLCWSCASDRERIYLLVPERTGDGDLGPGKTIAVFDRAGVWEATVELPARLTRIAVDGRAIFGFDINADLRIFKLERR